MLDKIRSIEARYDELTRLMGEAAAGEHQRLTELAIERSEIENIVEKGREYQQYLHRLEEAESLRDSADAEMRDLALSEIDDLRPKVEKLQQEILSLLLPKDPRDSRAVIMEIRAGTGGEEAALFAADLFRLYCRYAERKGWEVEILSQNETGIGGFKEIIFSLRGKGAYSRLKYDSGVHRVQRIPTTESSGRIHTSTVTVAVLAEVDDVEVHIPESDIKIDIYKSAGAGGQNVQKNATAVRLTHIPTGIVVACQDERSQLQNRLRALNILRARLYDIEARKQQEELESNRRSQVGTGERSEKIRTYNYPQSRVTDHRINISSYNLATVMDGDIDMFTDELSLQEETERLAKEKFDT